ncbi:MAG: 2-amino-4-hydroxy-6-hydroxymethyldihydropteridine pyrophosphokinase [Acidimicrobiales bacterium]|nr:MAG: 2-amino-4-hydroxy-6-hydroxymethyldihydropteridine diphosphokinase [Actinomycetota bacterium]MBV6508460.1 2-amino-4-hydroxy-6-hydroxymethyldihydropteridine pyrophosphokinase [Acidimicrobiales bacterium]RIK04736.1 MAG: 2-amino-4-hydroxy-6-hydroxymethyldihydropteridine diphosphokinase [Acidobacteriota bacterium]
MTRTFLGLGSNLGDRRGHLRAAVEHLDGVVRTSPVYETEPVGGPAGQAPYLNLVVELDTDLTPDELLARCRRIEAAHGRVRAERWGPRTLDVDIVWMEGVEVDRPDLQVPHPRWRQRRFVMAPLHDLAPDLATAADVERADGNVRMVEPLL